MTGQRLVQQSLQHAGTESPLHVELATKAVLAGWTREQVIDTLISRIRRDRRYLAYRKACNRRTNYDDQVQQDMRALALAACWLADAGAGGGGRMPIEEGGQGPADRPHRDQRSQPHHDVRRPRDASGRRQRERQEEAHGPQKREGILCGSRPESSVAPRLDARDEEGTPAGEEEQRKDHLSPVLERGNPVEEWEERGEQRGWHSGQQRPVSEPARREREPGHVALLPATIDVRTAGF